MGVCCKKFPCLPPCLLANESQRMFFRYVRVKRKRDNAVFRTSSVLRCEALESRFAFSAVAVSPPVLPIALIAVAVEAPQATTGTFGVFAYSATATGVTITDCDTTATTAVIPASINGIPVTSIAANGFAGCTNLVSVTIPDTVTDIGPYAFYSCPSLASVTIPNGVTGIGEATFQNCPGLVAASLGSGIASIGRNAFYQCASLKSIDIPDNVASIGDAAFSFCSGLQSIRFGASLKTIGDGAFERCGVRSLNIPSSVTSIGSSAFLQCWNIESVSLGRGLTFVGSYAFADCRSLPSIAVPASVVTVGHGAFQSCYKLVAVFFLGSPPSLDGELGSNAVARYPIDNQDWAPYARASFGGLPAKPMAQPTAPGVPVADVGDSSATLNWAAPSFNGGAPVTDYIVEYSKDKGLAWAIFDDGVSPSTSSTVSALINGTSYILRVTALNLMGASPVSGNSSDMIPAAKPTAPANVTVAPGQGQVQLSWSAASSDPSSPITDYVVQWSVNSGVAWMTLNDSIAAATETVATGLTNGVGYIFRVAAVNAVGVGAYSTQSAAVTPRTVPGSPSSAMGTAGNGTVKLTWTAPVSDGGSPINSYQIMYSRQAGQSLGPWVTISQPASAINEAVIGSLENGSLYVFRVGAVNAAGAGQFSSPDVLVTPATIATAPTAISGVAGNGSVTLTWMPPVSNGGSPITDYVVQWSVNGGTAWTTFNDGVSVAPTAVVTGLTNGSPFLFRVLAINAAGTSVSSAASSSVTPRTAPGSPTGVRGTGGIRQVSLVWASPASNGGAPVTDYLVQWSVNAGLSWTTFTRRTSAQTSARVTGLLKGKSYIFRIAAINTAGVGAYSVKSLPIRPR